MMQPSEDCLRLIRQFEGLRLTAYVCPAGKWTVGYGHTLTAREGMTITMDQAVNLLRDDAATAAQHVRHAITAPLEQHQFDALVSWCFNVGGGAVQRSTLRKRLNAGAYDDVPAQLMRWVKVSGKDSNGLIRRRRAECAMWRGVTHTATVETPVVPDEPREKPITTSKTLKGAIPSVVGAVTAAGGVLSALGGLSPLAQAIIGGGLVAAMLGGGYVVWNRLGERKRGER